ncbi:MAG TPA: SurA N-terminal domain-containing protein [Thermodesulfobacteriota bacterium]|nr:SurA N-terminal domain-containing protein [Thermodesulfobacteriota bacterium]
MLSVLRKYARSIFIYFIPFLIISFVLYFGWTDIRERQESWMVKVNKTTISVAEYRKYYTQIIEYYKKIYQVDLTPDLIERLGIKQQITDNLINELLLLETAKEANLMIPEAELKKAIEAIPGFQKNGRFDNQAYQELLHQNKLTPQDFENDQRKGLLVSRIRDLVIDGVKYSEKELQDKFIWENEKVDLEFAEIDPETFSNVGEPQEEEIRAYYDKHKEEFRVPEKIKISYIEFSPEDFENKATVSPEEIDEYYKNFSEEFWEPRKVHARHILIKINPGAKSEEKKEAEKKAEEILSLIKGGKSFEQMALMYSQDQITAKEGGDLGFFPRGQMIKEFDDAAFNLKPGEVSGVVETKFGFHIIKVEEIKEERTKPLEEVKEEIREKLIKEKTQDLIKKEAYQCYRTLLKTKDLKGYADKERLKLLESAYFSREESPPIAGDSGEFIEEIFGFNPGEIASPKYINESYYIIQLDDKKKSYLPPVGEVKEKIGVILKKEAQKEAAKRKGEEVLKKAIQESSFQKVITDQEKIVIKETGLFARTSNNIPNIGVAPEMMVAAFSLRPEAPFAKEIFEVGGKIYLIKLKTREEVLPQKFLDEKSKVEKRYLYEKTNNYLGDWLKNGRLQANIVFNQRVNP